MEYCDGQNPTAGPLRVEAGQASDIGLVRPLNEDSILTLQLVVGEGSKSVCFGLYAVADGVGGYEGGEIASALALRVVTSSILQSLIIPELQRDTKGSGWEHVSQVLTDGVRAANDRIQAEGQARGNRMGTTLTAALIINGTAHIANVGDSRAYLLERDQLRQITADHSLVAMLVTAGELTPEEIYTHSQRNIITRCLGTKSEVEVDLFTERLGSGSALLLCSDGLWEMIRDDHIRDAILHSENAQDACDQLVATANRNGGADNVSVVVLKTHA